MKIHVYLLCYNEEYIIEQVIRYYSTFCSKIFILDNHSTDNSMKIASSYDNVNIIYWDSNELINEYLYVKIKTEIYKKYSREDGKYTEEIADWVICCDMDEILYAPNIKSSLNKCSLLNITVPQIMGFEMKGANEPSTNALLTEQYKHGYRNPRFDKRVIFSPEIDIAYNVGCHPEGVGFEYMKKTYGYKSSSDVVLYLLHFKDIGTRLLDVAKKNSRRIKKGQVIKKNGNYYGHAYHYQAIIDGAIKSTANNNFPIVINNDGTINDAHVLPATGEKGIGNREIISFMDDIKFFLQAGDPVVFLLLKKAWVYKNKTLVFDFRIKKYNMSFDLSYISKSQCTLEIIDRDQQLLLKYNNIKYDFKKDSRYEILRLDNNVLINKISLITNLITSYVNAVAKNQ